MAQKDLEEEIFDEQYFELEALLKKANEYYSIIFDFNYPFDKKMIEKTHELARNSKEIFDIITIGKERDWKHYTDQLYGKYFNKAIIKKGC